MQFFFFNCFFCCSANISTYFHLNVDIYIYTVYLYILSENSCPDSFCVIICCFREKKSFSVEDAVEPVLDVYLCYTTTTLYFGPLFSCSPQINALLTISVIIFSAFLHSSQKKGMDILFNYFSAVKVFCSLYVRHGCRFCSLYFRHGGRFCSLYFSF